MKLQGIPGRGGSNLPVDRDLLAGVLASEDHHPVMPDDYCLECQREGKDSGKCFHRHWRIADDSGVAERRVVG